MCMWYISLQKRNGVWTVSGRKQRDLVTGTASEVLSGVVGADGPGATDAPHKAFCTF